jgi:trehalose/maltose hydrolase-like predicted phosphorylase
LRKEWNVLKETADFWVSRVKNKDGSYSILNVVGADEYAQHVDDNAFTNASAIESLKHHKSGCDFGRTVDPRWVDISDNLVIQKKMELPKL